MSLSAVIVVWQNNGKGEAEGGNWLISRFDRETDLFSAVVHVRLLQNVCFDVRFIWQHSKDSREVGIYQHKMN